MSEVRHSIRNIALFARVLQEEALSPSNQTGMWKGFHFERTHESEKSDLPSLLMVIFTLILMSQMSL